MRSYRNGDGCGVFGASGDGGGGGGDGEDTADPTADPFSGDGWGDTLEGDEGDGFASTRPDGSGP